MSKVLQEKFQVVVPDRPEGENVWVSQKRARVAKGSTSGDNVFLGTLPPGTDIEDQEIADIREQPLVFAGESDVSMDNNPEARRNGFTKRTMRPTDDQYTREHNDAFYDEITVDGVTGFLERNNVLDRL
jgi:hypothetical protein